LVLSNEHGSSEHLKTGKHAKVGDKPLKKQTTIFGSLCIEKQATIFGSLCIEKARSERATVEADPDRVFQVWTLTKM
jgi:hypothetical protein